MQQLAEKSANAGGCKLCPKFTHTFSILGKKWNGLIIEALLVKVLCERLKELEDEHIVVRNTYEGENRIDYSLTERGQELREVMSTVHRWSDKWN